MNDLTIKNTILIAINAGDVYGEFTVISEQPRYIKPNGATERVVYAKCSCGVEKSVRLHSLRSGATVSCGHIQREKARDNKSQVTHGKSKTNIYSVWRSMIQRCHSPSNKSFYRYGAKGITVCDRWRNSFLAFSIDMGERPEGLTLDRINSKGNYEPSNTRWATYKQQARNTSRNHLHTIDGVTHCLAEWCEILCEPWTTVKKRVAAGHDPFTRMRPDRRLYAQQ